MDARVTSPASKAPLALASIKTTPATAPEPVAGTVRSSSFSSQSRVLRIGLRRDGLGERKFQSFRENMDCYLDFRKTLYLAQLRHLSRDSAFARMKKRRTPFDAG